MKELLGDKVKNVKRGTRADRKHVYFNIKRIQPAKKNPNQQDSDINLAEKLTGVAVPED